MNTDLRNFTGSNNLYEILSVAPNANESDIKSAYRRLVVIYHPDKYITANDKQVATEAFKRISVAFKTLSSLGERQRYDAGLRAGQTVNVADAAREEKVSPLVIILQSIHARSDIFQQDQIGTLNDTLRKLVTDNLLREKELAEKVVGAVPIEVMPAGLKKERGSFSSGSMVYTTLRLLFAYTLTWDETYGNKRITHTDSYVQAIGIWDVDRLTVKTSGRLHRKTELIFTRSDQPAVVVRPKTLDITRLLALLTLWGVPLRDLSEDNAAGDVWAEATEKPATIWAAFLLVYIGAGILVCCNEEWGPITGLTAFLNDFGIFQAAVLASFILGANGAARAISEHMQKNVREVIDEMKG